VRLANADAHSAIRLDSIGRNVAYLYAAKGDARAALTRAVSDAIIAIEELRSGLEQAEQAVSFGFVRGEFASRSL